MTNAEKYLKDGVTTENFMFLLDSNGIIKERNGQLVIYASELQYFLNKNTKPTLTEDEKVILRHLDKGRYNKIGKDEHGQSILKFTGENGWLYETYFPNDFKSLQPRRRI